ncbi:unnamed protein product, partial [Didymodactylos carnosus]
CFTDCYILLNFTDADIPVDQCTKNNVSDSCLITLIANQPKDDEFATFQAVDADTMPLFFTDGKPYEVLRTMIWFRKKQTKRTFSYMCSKEAFCGVQKAQDVFDELKEFYIDSVWNNLGGYLLTKSCKQQRKERRMI